MIKKLLLAAVIGFVGFAAVKHTKFGGIARQEVESLGEWAESQVPVEKEIARLRKEVSSLDKDINKTASALAKEIVEVRSLKEASEDARTGVAADEDKLRARAEELKDATEKVKSATGTIKYGRVTVTPGEAKDMLKADVSRVVTRRTTADNYEKTLVARERIKDSLEKQLDSLKKQKLELSVQIDAFEAEYKAQQFQQMDSKYQVDATRLGGIKESLRSLKKKLDIETERMKLNPRVVEDAPAPANTQSVDEIIAGLDGKKTK